MRYRTRCCGQRRRTAESTLRIRIHNGAATQETRPRYSARHKAASTLPSKSFRRRRFATPARSPRMLAQPRIHCERRRSVRLHRERRTCCERCIRWGLDGAAVACSLLAARAFTPAQETSPGPVSTYLGMFGFPVIPAPSSPPPSGVPAYLMYRHSATLIQPRECRTCSSRRSRS